MADGSRTFEDPATGDIVIEADTTSSDKPVVGHFGNLAVNLVPTTDLRKYSASITELVANDQMAREPWLGMLAENVKLLGLGEESEPDDFEYENSDRSDHPLLLTALTRFQSKALSAVLPLPDKVCHTKCATDLSGISKEDQRRKVQDEADDAGERVEDFIADYLVNRLKTYRQDTDMILRDCGMHGIGLRKVYNDFSRASMKTRVERVDLQKLVISLDTRSMAFGRMTEIIDMSTPDLIRNIQNGTFRAPDQIGHDAPVDHDPLTEAEMAIQNLRDEAADPGSSHRVYEVYLDLFIKEDAHPRGLARPYVVSIHAASQEILSLRRNWVEGDPDETPIERYVAWTFSPGMNEAEGIGLGHLLSNITKALRSAQRRGLEAGYLQNHPFGYKLSSMKIRDGGSKIRPGEFVDVDSPTSDIRQAIQMQTFQGPSQGLLALADKMESNGRELGGIATIDFTQLMKAGIAAGPAMAAYDESTEFQTAIHSRLYHAHATELRLIMDRMREVYGSTEPVNFGTNSLLWPGDLVKVDLTPIMQPGQISRQRQVLQAQAVYDLARENPKVIDLRRATINYVDALGISDTDDLILPDPKEVPPPKPADPVSEYAKALRDEPIRAGLMQNHQAHIDAHSSQMRMVQTSKLPIEQGQRVMAQLAAHIADHMGKQMLVEVGVGLGMSPEEIGKMAPEMEAQLAPAIAERVAEIEEARRPEEQVQESRVDVEAVKGQNQQALQGMKDAQAKELQEMKHRHAMELQQLKDDNAMDRAEQDDQTAMAIAELTGSRSQSAGTSSS